MSSYSSEHNRGRYVASLSASISVGSAVGAGEELSFHLDRAETILALLTSSAQLLSSA